MIPVELLSPFRQEKREKYKKVLSAYKNLRTQGVAAEVAKTNVAARFSISKSGVEYIIRNCKE